VKHRHLLPEELDLLADNEEGFGVAPLRGHIDECDECRSSLARLEAVVARLEMVPHFAPSPLFRDRVMSRVDIFQPTHVAVREWATGWIPRSPIGRLAAGVGGGVAAAGISVAAVWIASRADAVLFVLNLAAQRGRDALVSGASAAASGLLGPEAVGAIQSGGALAVAGAVAATAIAASAVALGVRAVASSGSRRRS
jgi:hypothetical protein